MWTIAADASHRDADLLDQLVDHPATYRALSDWAVAGLAEHDVKALPEPPAPDEDADTDTARRGLRIPTVSMPRRRREAASTAVSAPTPEPAPSSLAEPDETDDDDGEGLQAWLAAAPAPAPAGGEASGARTLEPAPSSPPTGSRATVASWLRHPAPIGLVIVLAVVEVLTLLALGVVAQREPASVPAIVPRVVSTTPAAPSSTAGGTTSQEVSE